MVPCRKQAYTERACCAALQKPTLGEILQPPRDKHSLLTTDTFALQFICFLIILITIYYTETKIKQVSKILKQR